MNTVTKPVREWPCVATSPNDQPGFRWSLTDGQLWVQWTRTEQVGGQQKQVVLWFMEKPKPRRLG